MSDYPKLRVGDPVLYYPNPHSETQRPLLGWCLSDPVAGQDSVNLLVFTDEAGFVQRIAIRHRNNPILREKPTLAALGGWDEAPIMRDMRKLEAAKIGAIRSAEKASAGTKTDKKS